MKIFNPRIVAAIAFGAVISIGAPSFAAPSNDNLYPTMGAPEQGRFGNGANQHERGERLKNRGETVHTGARRGGARHDKAGTRGGNRQNGQQGLAQQLNLTDEQQEKFRSIRTKMRGESESIRQDSALSEEQKRMQVKELRQRSQEKIARLLTPEQRRQLQQARVNGQRGAGRQGHNRGGKAQHSNRRGAGQNNEVFGNDLFGDDRVFDLSRDDEFMTNDDFAGDFADDI